MDVASGRVLLGAATVRFEDSLGRRYQADGPAGDPLEVLVLRDELCAAQGFEEALRQQVRRLAAFTHPSLGRIRGVARVARSETGLAVISDRVKGIRLSDLIAAAEKRQLAVDASAALWITRQVLSALAALHETGPECHHGALAPERIVITPDGRPVVMEQVLGPALAKVAEARLKPGTTTGVGLKPGTTYKQGADVTQLGAVALSLLLGRALGDEFPAHVRAGADATALLSTATALELVPKVVRSWMSRALELESHEPFASAVEARAEFERAIGELDARGAEGAKRFVEAAMKPEERRVQKDPPYEAKTEARLKPSTTYDDAKPHTEVPLPPARAASPAKARGEGGKPSTTTEVRLKPDTTYERERVVPSTRRRLVAAAAVVLAMVSGAAYATHRYYSASAEGVPTGALVVNTDPSGAAVSVDGEERGRSPLRLTLAPGTHVLDIAGDGAQRKFAVAITAGTEVQQFIELPKAAAGAGTGRLQVSSEPSGARVMIEGQPRGTTPVTIDGLTPGSYSVTLEGELGSVTQQVAVQPGALASLVVPLGAPRGAPVSGWVAIAAPAEVQIFENHRLVCSSRLDRIMFAVGRHELEVVNETLGYRSTRTVNVTPGQVANVALEWPRGSLALNAVPWADVWIDDERVGETPIGNVQVPIGSHEVVFRHPDLGEQRHTVVVTMAGEARVSADMRRR
ncbi:MAG: hypothetical protein A3F70_14180 [Acidobacteria bacterium RIFCSPLOWO2_12_FULL_67_14]|nr:MAG: hypothetical protein A3F70_14180 [Acidobacteria bacterium RIFCSPLOWO2_12_FULL_67_14]